MAWSWMPGSRRQQAPLGADKNYDTRGCVDALRCTDATPYVAQNTSNRSSAIDGRATRHSGYAMSQRFRKRIGECFGWVREQNLVTVHAAFLVTDSVDTLAQLSKKIPHETTEKSGRFSPRSVPVVAAR